MKEPAGLRIIDYTYVLPENRIAHYPLTERDASRLLVYNKGIIESDVYANIAAQIPADSLMILNDTKVIEARLVFQKPTGGMIEIFCLEPHEQYRDITQAMAQQGNVTWKCLVGGASKWKPGQVLALRFRSGTALRPRSGTAPNLTEEEITLEARFVEKTASWFHIAFSWAPAISFAELLHLAGAIPLPPYIKRAVEENDATRYQTVYAHYDGSVAAPTAGLHFTEKIFESLRKKNIHRQFVTLHVGAGTFKPVKAETLGEHEMHAEWIDVSKETIQVISGHADKTIIAVGTTSLRTIESLYWLGLQLSHSPHSSTEQPLFVSQWEVYNAGKQTLSASASLALLLAWMEKNKLSRIIARTQILIAPGYQFKLVRGLVTNFHQPQSTLLLLVAALIGDDWKKVYGYALENDFRFLSYGDGSLLWKH